MTGTADKAVTLPPASNPGSPPAQRPFPGKGSGLSDLLGDRRSCLVVGWVPSSGTTGLSTSGGGEHVAAHPEKRWNGFHRALGVEYERPAFGGVEPVVDVSVQPEGAFQSVPLDLGKTGVGELLRNLIRVVEVSGEARPRRQHGPVRGGSVCCRTESVLQVEALVDAVVDGRVAADGRRGHQAAGPYRTPGLGQCQDPVGALGQMVERAEK